MEIIHVLIADYFGYLIDLQLILNEQILGMIDPDIINITVKINTDDFTEYFAQIGTIVPKQRSN
jgi:hypothetical protein